MNFGKREWDRRDYSTVHALICETRIRDTVVDTDNDYWHSVKKKTRLLR